MTNEEKAKRILEIDAKMCELAKEMFELVNPSVDEIELSADLLQDDASEAVDILLDASAPVGMWYLAGEAIVLREQQ